MVAWPRGSKQRPPTVIVLNDLFPDALVLAGILRPKGWAVKCLGAMTRYYLKESEAAVYLGKHLMTYAEQRYGRTRNNRIIPVGGDAKFICAAFPSEVPSSTPIRILYSGTMGHMHDTDTLIDVFCRGLPKGIHFTFHSSGVGYGRLSRALEHLDEEKGRQVSLLGPLSDQAWRETLTRHAIGLVTLRDGAEHISMPSKAYSALAAGQAILAICAIDSDLAELITRHNCGWVIAPGRGEELLALLVHISENPEEVHAKRLEAFRAGHSIYDISTISQQYLDLFDLMLEGSR